MVTIELTVPATAQIADACLRRSESLRVVSGVLRSLHPGNRIAGRARPVRHTGSVDIILEALTYAEPGDVLVIDNAGNKDEGCIGDLVAMEALAAGIAGIVIWGCHRDTDTLTALELPVFSLGACPAGPWQLDPSPPDALDRAQFQHLWIDRSDTVFVDDDGMVVISEHVAEIVATARDIETIEREQADILAMGRPLREQLRFTEYLAQRQREPDFTFREHLRRIGGAIEDGHFG